VWRTQILEGGGGVGESGLGGGGGWRGGDGEKGDMGQAKIQSILSEKKKKPSMKESPTFRR